MPVIDLFLHDTLVDGWCRLSETADAAATSPTGWIVSTGATLHSKLESGVKRAASTFAGTTDPDGTLDTTLFDAFRSENPYTGSFPSGNWVLHFVVRAVTNGGAQDGRVRFRLIKANADGSNATEITSGQQQASAVSNVSTAADFDSTLTFNPGAFSIDNQYLFIQIAWERTGAGGMTTADILFRTGSSTTVGTRITTTNFSPTFSKSGTDGAEAADSASATKNFAPVSGTDGAKASDRGVEGFVVDSFTDTNGNKLAQTSGGPGHVGEAGSTWVNNPSGDAINFVIASNRVRGSSSTGSPKVVFATGVPSSAEYMVRGELYVASIPTAEHRAFLAARLHTSQQTMYAFGYHAETGFNRWELYKIVSGVATLLDSFEQELEVGETYVIEFHVTNSNKWATVDGVQVCNSADNDITAANKVGLRNEDVGEAPTDSTGLHWDKISAHGIIRAPSGGNFNKSGTDGTKATDSSTVERVIGKSGTDGAKATDDASVGVSSDKSGTDGAKASDDATVTVTSTYEKSGTDGARASDGGTVTLTRVGTGSDGAKAGDDSTVVRTRPASGSDGAKAADSVIVSRTRPASGSDGAKAADSIIIVMSRPATGTDGAKAADSSTPVRTRPASGTDGAKASDSSTVELLTAGQYSKSGTDGAIAADSATVIHSQQVAGNDGAKAIDSGSIVLNRLGLGADGAKGTDAATGQLISLAQAIDIARASDDGYARIIYNVSATDGAKAFDQGTWLPPTLPEDLPDDVIITLSPSETLVHLGPSQIIVNLIPTVQLLTLSERKRIRYADYQYALH